MNATVPLQLVGNELEYLRYFMYVVRGDAGAFRLLDGKVLTKAQEHLADEYKKATLTKGGVEIDAIRAAMDRIANPPQTQFIRVAARGGIVFRAQLLYSATVFSAELLVNPDGTIEMKNDIPLGEVEGLGE